MEIYNGPKYLSSYVNNSIMVMKINRKNSLNVSFVNVIDKYPSDTASSFYIDNVNIFSFNIFGDHDNTYKNNTKIIYVNFDELDLHTFHIIERIISKITTKNLTLIIYKSNEFLEITDNQIYNLISNDDTFIQECPLTYELIKVQKSFGIHDMQETLMLFGCGNVDYNFESKFTELNKYDYMFALDLSIDNGSEIISSANATAIKRNVNIFDFQDYKLEIPIGKISEISSVRSLEHLTMTQLKQFPKILKENFYIDNPLRLTFVVPDYKEVMKYSKNLKLFSTANHKVNAEIFGYNDWETDSDHKFMWTKSLLNQYINYFGKVIERSNVKILKNNLLSINSPIWYRRVHAILKG